MSKERQGKQTKQMNNGPLSSKQPFDIAARFGGR